jgi:hypothetical protein
MGLSRFPSGNKEPGKSDQKAAWRLFLRTILNSHNFKKTGNKVCLKMFRQEAERNPPRRS